MSNLLYVVYDTCSKVFSPIQCYKNNEVAIRSSRYSVNSDPQIKSCAKDLELYCIGSIDYNTGVIVPCDKQLVIRFVDLLDKE